jgi:integrative and conjugative element protein (TIGR02256 family)
MAAQEIVNRAWRESDGELNYLGEWHTHSVPHPTPSGQDRDMIGNMFRDSVLGVHCLFTVVVLREIWVGRMDRRALKQLQPVIEEGTR